MNAPIHEAIEEDAYRFPERTPFNGYEERLYGLQTEGDRLGFTVARQVTFGLFESDEIDFMAALSAQARAELELAGMMNEHVEFSSRYIYETRKPNDRQIPQLVYPADSMHHSARVEGKITDIKPVLVTHPHIIRNGLLGFRICAVVSAHRVMGLTTREPENYYVPIGEIYTEGVTYSEGMAQILQPRPKRR